VRTLFVKTFFIAFLAISTIVAIFALQAHAGGTFHGTPGDDVIHMNDEAPPAATAVRAGAGADRVWGGIGSDSLYGGPGNDRLHNFQAGAGALFGGPGYDVCVVGMTPGGSTNVTVHSCEKVVYRSSQGHG
jgi:Ca2+-binding RTX toxin-like protein